MKQALGDGFEAAKIENTEGGGRKTQFYELKSFCDGINIGMPHTENRSRK